MSALRLMAVWLVLAPVAALAAEKKYQPQAGDIILFKVEFRPFACRWPKRPVVRVATGSGYIHVGVLVEDAEGRLWFLDADKTTGGVGLHQPQPYFRQARSFYDRIEVRQIQEPLSKKEKQRLWQFAQSQEGHAYAGLKELATAAFSAPLLDRLPSPDELVPKSEERWFCSELTVGAFQKIGRLSRHLRASSIVPRQLATSDLLSEDQWSPPLGLYP